MSLDGIRDFVATFENRFNLARGLRGLSWSAAVCALSADSRTDRRIQSVTLQV